LHLCIVEAHEKPKAESLTLKAKQKKNRPNPLKPTESFETDRTDQTIRKY